MCKRKTYNLISSSFHLNSQVYFFLLSPIHQKNYINKYSPHPKLNVYLAIHLYRKVDIQFWMKGELLLPYLFLRTAITFFYVWIPKEKQILLYLFSMDMPKLHQVFSIFPLIKNGWGLQLLTLIQSLGQWQQ